MEPIKKSFRKGTKVEVLKGSGWVRKGDILEVEEIIDSDGSHHGYPDKKTEIIKCRYRGRDLHFRPEELKKVRPP